MVGPGVATRADVPPVDLPWPVDGRGRTVLRRRSLPRGRAVVGGFLISTAAVVTFTLFDERAPRRMRPGRYAHHEVFIPLNGPLTCRTVIDGSLTPTPWTAPAAA